MAIFPDETNTGIPKGVTLTSSGNLYINEPGITIENLSIKGSIYINADNVTVQNCKVTSSEFYVIKVAEGITGVTIQDSEIDGIGTGNEGSTGIAGQGTFLRNNIYNVENGFAIQGDNSLIQDNYVHDLKASGSPHYDGIQIDGGVSDVVISHNTIINDHDQTAAVMIDNYFGSISNIKVDGNLLVGGGYTVYSDGQFDGGSISGVSFTNNHLGEGYWGYRSFVDNSPVWENNATDGHALAETLNQQVDITTTPDLTAIDPITTDSTSSDESTTDDTSTDSTTTTAPESVIYDQTVWGTSSGDYLWGGAGNDMIIGGLGRDILTGLAGNDLFVFRSAAEAGSNLGSRDIIRDFTQGEDRIDLSEIDANGYSAGDASFAFISEENALFDRREGAVAWHLEDRPGTFLDHTVIQGDLDGDGWHDFEIQLSGLVNLAADDFIL